MEHKDAAANLSVLPFLADRPADQTIYQAIGVEPIINCRGTFTIIGGSVERPEVLTAMEAAAGYFVQYDELAAAVGQAVEPVLMTVLLSAAGCLLLVLWWPRPKTSTVRGQAR